MGQKCNKYIKYNYGDDGIIMGVYTADSNNELTLLTKGDISDKSNNNIPIKESSEHLDEECCSELGHIYDNSVGKCYYKENLCKDINGDWVNQFVFDEDGVVYGYYMSEESNNTTINNQKTRKAEKTGNARVAKFNLDPECCDKLGYDFDYNKNKCYYKRGCENIKIVFNVNGESGLVFTKGYDQNCYLNLSFDYLISYLVEDITNYFNELPPQTKRLGVSDVIDKLKLSLLIEKKVPDGLETILKGDLYELNGDDGYNDCGIKIEGLNSTINALLDGDRLLNEDDRVNIVKGDLISYNVNIKDEAVINAIIDEEIKFSILVENMLIDFSIEMDNIVLDKVCENTIIREKIKSDISTYDLVKTIDNKKSWVSTKQDRIFDLSYRDTDYSITDERLVLNTKEIDLETSVSNAIEEDVSLFIKNNPGILIGDGGDTYSGIDLTKLLSKKVENITFIKDIIKMFYSELIDVKSRKVISGYPNLKMIYERYLNSEYYLDGVKSNSYDYRILDKFLDLLGNYWVDLIEQVIPATTLWGGSHIIKNMIFNDNKFKYRRYSLKFCKSKPTKIASNIGFEDVEVIQTYLQRNRNVERYNKQSKCNEVYIESYNDDASTIDFISYGSTELGNVENVGSVIYISEELNDG